jgi:hypothetical protein
MLLVQAQPGPMDAFQANYASIKAELDFNYTQGTIDGSTVADWHLWESTQVQFAEKHDLQIIGHWACDGSTEYYDFSSPDDVIAEGRKQPPVIGARVPYVPRVEAIYNGETRAAHIINDEITLDRGYVVNVYQDGELGPISLGKGPFLWWITYPFPKFVQVHFPGVLPSHMPGYCGGRQVEIEVYRKQQTKGWIQVEVFYDPTIGYLPRFARSISNVGLNTFVKEMYLIDAQPCSAGGFVPLEWFGLDFVIKDFESRYPNYHPEIPLSSPTTIGIYHFKADRFRSLATPVHLKHLEGVHTISTSGGRVPMREGTANLTLAALKSALGARLSNPALRVLPRLDQDELSKFKQPPPTRRTVYLLTTLVAVSLVVSLWAIRRRRLQLLALPITCCLIAPGGCGRPQVPVVKMSGELSPSRFLMDLSERDFSLKLMLRNDGNQPLRLFKASAGCSCRKVEQSRFPCTLEPGSALELPVKFTNSRKSTPEQLLFSFETSHGIVEVPVSLHHLPRHQLDPESLGHAFLDEGDEWAFEIVHRAIGPIGEKIDGCELAPPVEFQTTKIATSGGTIAAAPEYQYLDTTYRLSQKDRSLGMHKAILRVLGADGKSVAESAIVWKRVPFLSCTPEKVVLGTKPVRVFLRCRDDSVELAQVVRSPEGIKSVISSVRELTVIPTDAASPVINDFIEVRTTADNRPPLRIPVVRYAPASRPAGTAQASN